MMNRVKSFCNASQEDLLGLCDTVITLSRKKYSKLCWTTTWALKDANFKLSQYHIKIRIQVFFPPNLLIRFKRANEYEMFQLFTEYHVQSNCNDEMMVVQSGQKRVRHTRLNVIVPSKWLSTNVNSQDTTDKTIAVNFYLKYIYPVFLGVSVAAVHVNKEYNCNL